MPRRQQYGTLLGTGYTYLSDWPILDVDPLFHPPHRTLPECEIPNNCTPSLVFAQVVRSFNNTTDACIACSSGRCRGYYLTYTPIKRHFSFTSRKGENSRVLEILRSPLAAPERRYTEIPIPGSGVGVMGSVTPGCRRCSGAWEWMGRFFFDIQYKP